MASPGHHLDPNRGVKSMNFLGEKAGKPQREAAQVAD